MEKVIYYSIVLISSLFVFVLITNCSSEDSLIEDSQSSRNYVIQTHYENLGNGVDSVQLVSEEYPVLKKALSEEFKLSIKLEDLAAAKGVYFYNNGFASLLVSNKDETEVYAYIFDINNQKIVDAQLWEFTKKSTNFKNSENNLSVKVKSIKTGKLIYKYENGSVDPTLRGTSFGQCMDESMDNLFNDWDNSVMGTLSCWVMSASCAVGAVIYCSFS